MVIFYFFFVNTAVALSVSNLSAGNIADEKGNESWIGVKRFNDNLKVVCGPFSYRIRLVFNWWLNWFSMRHRGYKELRGALS